MAKKFSRNSKASVYGSKWFALVGAIVIMATIVSFFGIFNICEGLNELATVFVFAFGLAFSVFFTLHEEILRLREINNEQKRLLECKHNRRKEKNK